MSASPTDVDVIVVGAGPAGAAAALALRSPLRRAGWAEPLQDVLLLDRAAFPRDKPCGDAIAWHAFDELRRLGVDDVRGAAPAIHELRLTGPRGTTVSGRTERGNHVIRRTVFDERLVRAAVASGAQLVQHRVRDVQIHRDHVVVDGRWRAPWLVAADGASSVVRRHLGIAPPEGRHRAIALRAYADAEEGQTFQRIAMRSHAWPSYAWSFPLEDGRANVGYGMRVSATGPGTREDLRRLTEEIATGGISDARVHPLPLSTGRPRPDHGRVLLVGDAASLINPLTGEGIFYAIASGRLAGLAIRRHGNAAGSGAATASWHRRAMRRRFGAHFATTSTLARLLDVESLAPVVIRAVRDPVAFADLAEIGLGEGTMTRHLATAIAAEAARTALGASGGPGV